MVEQNDAVLDETFRALADPTRRAMLRALSAGERSVGELAAPHRMSLAAASKHVKVLEAAGLINRTVSGRKHICCLAPGPLAQAKEWLDLYEHFWRMRLDALSSALDAAKPDEPE